MQAEISNLCHAVVLPVADLVPQALSILRKPFPGLAAYDHLVDAVEIERK
jgi:hypothetical protein